MNKRQIDVMLCWIVRYLYRDPNKKRFYNFKVKTSVFCKFANRSSIYTSAKELMDWMLENRIIKNVNKEDFRVNYEHFSNLCKKSGISCSHIIERHRLLFKPEDQIIKNMNRLQRNTSIHLDMLNALENNINKYIVDQKRMKIEEQGSLIEQEYQKCPKLPSANKVLTKSGKVPKFRK